MDCDDEILARRFTATRRRHPMAKDRAVADGIAREREITDLLKTSADHIIDTTDLTIHDLRRIIGNSFSRDQKGGLHITVMSFGFKYGMPRQMDLLFDVRFLKNPHFDPELKNKTGQDEDVAAYIKTDTDYDVFCSNLEKFLMPLLPRYKKEGKSYLTIAIGCTGGRHRSVHMVERLSKKITALEYGVYTYHRDIGK
jgi:UPF0042 nucleotide-binding protein